MPGLQQSREAGSIASTTAGKPAPQVSPVLQIFREIFRDDTIGPDDNFIELGGDSLAATRLATRCAEVFHARVSADMLFRYPTARLLGDAILARQAGRAGQDQDIGASLIPLVAGGTGPPVFLVPPLYGNSWIFQPLLACVEWTRPVLGCRPPDLDWDRNVLDTLEMADHYAAALRAAQPRGPYSIVGYSFGAAVAFEIACRLAAAGEDVRHLVLLEGVLPDGGFRWRSTIKHRYFAAVRVLFGRGVIGRRAVQALGFQTLGSQIALSFGSGPLTARELRMVLRLAAPGWAAARDLRTLGIAELCHAVVGHVKSALEPGVWGRLAREAGSEDPVAMVKAHKVALKNVWLAHQYKPRSIFPGTIVQYASTQNAHAARWQAFSAKPLDVRLVDVPAEHHRGAHSAFLSRPYVSLYAEGFRDLLQA